MIDQLKEEFPTANIETREGHIRMVIEWLLINIFTIGTELKVEMMGVDYPFEPDVYWFNTPAEVMDFIKSRATELGALKNPDLK